MSKKIIVALTLVLIVLIFNIFKDDVITTLSKQTEKENIYGNIYGDVPFQDFLKPAKGTSPKSSFKHIKQGRVKTCGFLRFTDWKRKNSVLVLSDFKHSDFYLSILP